MLYPLLLRESVRASPGGALAGVQDPGTSGADAAVAAAAARAAAASVTNVAPEWAMVRSEQPSPPREPSAYAGLPEAAAAAAAAEGGIGPTGIAEAAARAETPLASTAIAPTNPPRVAEAAAAAAEEAAAPPALLPTGARAPAKAEGCACACTGGGGDMVRPRAPARAALLVLWERGDAAATGDSTARAAEMGEESAPAPKLLLPLLLPLGMPGKAAWATG